MFSIYRRTYKPLSKYFTFSSISSASINKNQYCIIDRKLEFQIEAFVTTASRRNYFILVNQTIHSPLELKRHFSRKKDSKRSTKVEEDSESESDEEVEEFNEEFGDNLIKRSVPSLRLDTILKVGLGLSKKKIEQDFYAFKMRVNGNQVVKKALNVYIGDELDRVRGFSPDTSKYLIVDRVTIKGIDKVTGAGLIPVSMEVLKELTIENYEDPWDPSSMKELDK